MQRRLPIYLLLDCSESMVGGPHQAVQQGIQMLCNDLKGDPMALETAWISVIAFSRDAHQLLPLTAAPQFHPPTLHIAPGTHLGAALDLLVRCIQHEVRKNTSTEKGDCKPLVCLFMGSTPTDDWQGALGRMKATIGQDALRLIAIGCGDDVDTEVLGRIAPTVLLMRQASGNGPFHLETVKYDKCGSGAEAVTLPPPPPGIVIL